MKKIDTFGNISFEGLIDPDNLPQEFLELGTPPVFFQRPTPEMIINVAPEDHRESCTFVEDKATGLFYCLAGWISSTITRHAAHLEAATYKIKGGGYGLWPLEEYARPGYASASDIAKHHAGKWIRVRCKGKNGCKVEAVDDLELHDWSLFDPLGGKVISTVGNRTVFQAEPSEKAKITVHAFRLAGITSTTHPVLQSIIRKNKKEKEEAKRK